MFKWKLIPTTNASRFYIVSFERVESAASMVILWMTRLPQGLMFKIDGVWWVAPRIGKDCFVINKKEKNFIAKVQPINCRYMNLRFL